MIAPPNFSLLLIMACFWLVFLLVATQLVRPLGNVLDEREKRIRESRGALDEARVALDEAVARCERELAAAAAAASKERTALRAAGEAGRRARLDAARSQAAERLNALTREIEAASSQARDELRSRATLLARELAAHLLGRRLAS